MNEENKETLATLLSLMDEYNQSVIEISFDDAPDSVLRERIEMAERKLLCDTRILMAR